MGVGRPAGLCDAPFRFRATSINPIPEACGRRCGTPRAQFVAFAMFARAPDSLQSLCQPRVALSRSHSRHEVAAQSAQRGAKERILGAPHSAWTSLGPDLSVE